MLSDACVVGIDEFEKLIARNIEKQYQNLYSHPKDDKATKVEYTVKFFNE